ncbi:MAG: CinA family protein, partial [Lachnospiraceae bacterium]|nr:CinA family protein [Lachnospiraceae bacterium]
MEAENHTNAENRYEKIVKVCGLGLSELREQLADMLTATRQESFQLTPTLAGVDILVSAPDALNKESRDRVKNVVRELKVRLGSYIYTTDPEMTLEEHVVALRKKQKMTKTTVEYCTGGIVSDNITDVPGSAKVL